MKLPALTLTALSYAAIVTVYAAGYERTREAADRFDGMTEGAKPYEIPLPDGQTVRAVRPFVAPPKMATPATAEPASVPTIAAAPAPVTQAKTPSVSAGPVASKREASIGADSKVTATEAPKPESVIASSTPSAEASAPTLAGPIAPTTAPAPPPQPAAVTPIPTPAPVTVPTQAPTPTPYVAPPPPAPLVLKTGKFLGWGSCRHGDIEAEVQINRGLIIDVRITQCKTQYSCDNLDVITEEILDRQGPGVNYVAGSTQSTIALYNAVINAIAKAR